MKSKKNIYFVDVPFDNKTARPVKILSIDDNNKTAQVVGLTTNNSKKKGLDKVIWEHNDGNTRTNYVEHTKPIYTLSLSKLGKPLGNITTDRLLLKKPKTEINLTIKKID